MRLSCLSLLIALAAVPTCLLHAQGLPSKTLDVPLLDKPPTLTLPPPKIVPLPEGDGKAPAVMAPPAPVPSALPPPAAKGASTSSTSAGGQFIIHGADLQTRNWFTRFCETLAGDLQRLLRDPQPQAIPVVLSLRSGNDLSLSEPSVKAVVSELTTGGFQLQLTVQLRPDLNTNDLRAELIRILLAERILRGHERLTTTRNRILPEWMLVGVTEALRFKDRSRPSALFAAVFKTGKIYDIEEILEAAPGKLDALSRAVYETSACALVLALLDQPEGSLRMSKFLNSLAKETRGDRELINEWFPAVAESKNSLDKWWSLQMANMARPSVFETLDPSETAKALDEALLLRFQTEVEVTESARAAAVEAAPAAPETKERRGLLSRLFGRSDDKDKEKADEENKAKEEAKDKPKDEPPAKPEPKPEPEVKTAPPAKPLQKQETKPADQRPGLFRRWFGGDGKKDEDKTKEPAKKKEEAKPEKKATPPAPPGPSKEAKADEKKTTLNAAPVLRVVTDLLLPGATLVADATAWLNEPSAARYTILGFGKKKDKDAKEDETKGKKDDAKKEKAPPAKKEDPKKEEPKKPAASETKPVVKTRKVSASLPLEDYAKVLKRSDAKEIFANTAQSLAGLSQRAHPAFRPLIADYVKALADIAKGDTKGMDARLKALKEQQDQTLAQTLAARDFVDWYEASENSKWSGLFDDFLRVPEAVRQELPKRVDPLSRLLDEAEQQEQR
jgi:hypothetical protein